MSKSQYLIADWLKFLLDDLALPTVMLGLPRLEELLQTNEQLRRRFSRRVLTLDKTMLGLLEGTACNCFISLALPLNLPVSLAPFNNTDFGCRLHYATDGRIAYIKAAFCCLPKSASRGLAGYRHSSSGAGLHRGNLARRY